MKEKFESKQEYINTIAGAAQKACKRYGYLPSVLIAQSCLQNGFGVPAYWDNPEIKYLLRYNNMVGQKAELLTKSWYDKSVWPGKSFNKRTPEVYGGTPTTINDDFRVFDNIEQSFCDFILFLLYASNYGYNGKPKYGREVVDIKDPEKLIKQVGGRGYATGPTYPTSVMRIINENDLTKYDDLSNITPSDCIPESLKAEYGVAPSPVKKEKEIIDITAANRSQVPAARGNNPIEWIVIHYLGVPNADNPNLYGGGYGGHYNITRDGTIYKAADPKTAIVWHCGGGLQGSGDHPYYKICTNYNSIGIENSVCYIDPNQKSPSADSNKWYFTTETQESLIYLVSKLMDEYNIPFDHVIRHYDVNAKICPNPYVKNNKLNTSWTWDEFKSKLMAYRKEGQILTSKPQQNNPTAITLNNLSLGSTGDDVKQMQTMLIKCGYSCGAAGADGDFGQKTEAALKKFQKINDLVVDGVYGQKSKTKLLQLYNTVITSSKEENANYAKSFDKKIAKTYKTTAKLRLRKGPGMDKQVITIIPKGDKITCYGYYTDSWYYVQYKDFVGFCNKKWLK